MFCHNPQQEGNEKKWTGGKVMVTFTYRHRICAAAPHLADE
jgi:hypothetical protein